MGDFKFEAAGAAVWGAVTTGVDTTVLAISALGAAGVLPCVVAAGADDAIPEFAAGFGVIPGVRRPGVGVRDTGAGVAGVAFGSAFEPVRDDAVEADPAGAAALGAGVLTPGVAVVAGAGVDTGTDLELAVAAFELTDAVDMVFFIAGAGAGEAGENGVVAAESVSCEDSDDCAVLAEAAEVDGGGAGVASRETGGDWEGVFPRDRSLEREDIELEGCGEAAVAGDGATGVLAVEAVLDLLTDCFPGGAGDLAIDAATEVGAIEAAAEAGATVLGGGGESAAEGA